MRESNSLLGGFYSFSLDEKILPIVIENITQAATESDNKYNFLDTINQLN